MNYMKKSILKFLMIICLSITTIPVIPDNPSVITIQAASYSKSTIKAVQKKLNESGYECGKPDGIAGKDTKAAIKKYQKDNKLTVTGTVNKALLRSMNIKAAYTTISSNTKKNSASASTEKSTETSVYITDTGSKYHRSGCRYLRKSKIEISLSDAELSYSPCSVCKP